MKYFYLCVVSVYLVPYIFEAVYRSRCFCMVHFLAHHDTPYSDCRLPFACSNGTQEKDATWKFSLVEYLLSFAISFLSILFIQVSITVHLTASQRGDLHRASLIIMFKHSLIGVYRMDNTNLLHAECKETSINLHFSKTHSVHAALTNRSFEDLTWSHFPEKLDDSRSSSAPIRIFSAAPLHLSPSFISSSTAHALCVSSFSVSLSFCCMTQESPEYCRWVKPLRNGKQTCRVCKHWWAYRWCRANRQKSLHCSTQIAAIPLGLSLH